MWETTVRSGRDVGGLTGHCRTRSVQGSLKWKTRQVCPADTASKLTFVVHPEWSCDISRRDADMRRGATHILPPGDLGLDFGQAKKQDDVEVLLPIRPECAFAPRPRCRNWRCVDLA